MSKRSQNPLLQKPELGKNKSTFADPDKVYGRKNIKTDGGTAGALKLERLDTPEPSETVKQFQNKNPMLRKVGVGKAKPGVSKNADKMTHGRKNVKEDGVDTVMSNWSTVEQSASSTMRSTQPDVGRAKAPISEGVEDIVHGKPSKKVDGGTAEAIGKWADGQDVVKPKTKNPLLEKPELGQARRPIRDDVSEKVHGKKSEDPKLKGGVNGALTGWSNRPSTEDENRRLKQTSSHLYKPVVGRAKPSKSTQIEDKVHGRPNVKKDGGTAEAFSDYKPNTPKQRGRTKAHNVPKDAVFGKKSAKSDNLAELMSNKAARDYEEEQLRRTQELQ